MKRIFSWAVMIALTATLLPGLSIPETAAATGYGPNGNFLAPIEAPMPGSIAISTRTQLEAIRNGLGGTYHLVNDINLSGPEWTPIGSPSAPFTGVFDGQGFVIRNLRITGEGFADNGLFARTHNATVRNLGLEGVEISITPSSQAAFVAGGISAHNTGGVIGNCYAMGRISVINSFGAFTYAGGLTGLNFDGTIVDCYNTANIYAHDNHDNTNASGLAIAGGISARNSGILHKSFNTGDVHASSKNGDAYAGGVCGQNFTNNVVATITNVYNTGNVHAYDHGPGGRANAGGVAGSNAYIISNVYNTGDISSMGLAGGIAARNTGIISNAYWNSSATFIVGGNVVAGSGVGDGGINNTTALSASAMRGETPQGWSVYVGFDFINIWMPPPGLSVNKGFPIFVGQNAAGSFTAVTSITGGPTAATVGLPLTLSCAVNPSTATNRSVTWSIVDAGTTGATVTGDTLHTTAAGVVTVRATVANGVRGGNFWQDFDVRVTFVPVASITGLPSRAVAGVPLPLDGTVNPSNAPNRTILWNIVNAGTTGAALTGNTLFTSAPGIVTIQAVIVNGAAIGVNFTFNFNITVINLIPVTDITGVPDTTTAGANLSLTGIVNPPGAEGATNKTISWSIHDRGLTGATLTGNVLTTAAAGTVAVMATIENGTAVGQAYWQVFLITVHPWSPPGAPLPLPPGFAAPGFETASNWAVPHINQAYYKGFIPLGLQGSYTAEIERGEFVHLAMSWLNYYTGKTDDQLLNELGLTRIVFSDTTCPVIGAAGGLGITAGVGGREFGVRERFTRQQAAVMLANVRRIVDRNFTSDFANVPRAYFGDIGDAAPWAQNAINFMGQNRFMSGIGNDSAGRPIFGPFVRFTREQSITVFNNMR
jgi:hypothetical protein